MIDSSTLLIEVATQTYPVSLDQARRVRPNKSFAANPSEETMAELGFAVVHPSEKPEGDVVTEGKPVLLNGSFEQQWDVRAFTPTEADNLLVATKAGMSAKVDMLQAAALEKGAPYPFEGGVQHIQMRDGDRANMAGLRLRAEAAKASDPYKQFYLRTYENNTIPLTADEVITITDVVFDKYSLAMGLSWELKDQIKNAATKDNLPTLPTEISLEG